MRTSGSPSASTVASAMAFGSFGSAASASAIQARKSAHGSAASAKSPVVNRFNGFIPAVTSGRLPEFDRVTEALVRAVYRAIRRFGEARRLLAGALGRVLRVCLGGCSMSFPWNRSCPTTSPRRPGRSSRRRPRRSRPSSARRIGGAPRRRWPSRSTRRATAPRCPGTIRTPASRARSRRSAQPFVKGDEICRAFLAALGRAGRHAALQGTACRLSGGEWAIKDVKPVKDEPPEPACPGVAHPQHLTHMHAAMRACARQIAHGPEAHDA